MNKLTAAGLVFALIGCGSDDTVQSGLDGSAKDSTTNDVTPGADTSVADTGVDSSDAAMVPDTSVSCDAGQSACNGKCVDLTSDTQNCSKCGAQCMQGGSCCSSSCVDTQKDLSNCGFCGNTCNLPHATSNCNAGKCVVGSCNVGWANCNMLDSDGCEVNTQNDPMNCNSCNNTCPFGPHSMANCTNSQCTLACDVGYADCNKNPNDGCEVNTLIDKSNCGGCGTVCKNSCLNGKCM